MVSSMPMEITAVPNPCLTQVDVEATFKRDPELTQKGKR
jgi:hypothetical protein